MGSIYKLPIIGWFIGILISASLSVPLYFTWNEVAPTYLPMIPKVYQHIPFLDILCIVVAFTILKGLVFKGLLNIKSTSTSNCKDK